MTPARDPRVAVAALAGSVTPYLLGVRHHSPALAGAVPALLDASGAEAVCVELPADFQPWIAHLAGPGTVAPVALAGAGAGGRLAFHPFADFSPELAAVRWARERGVDVVCCDLPLSDPRWDADVAGPRGTDDSPAAPAETEAPAQPAEPSAFGAALVAAATGRDGDDLWDRCVEALAPGCAPEAIRRAALSVGWALRRDAASADGVSPLDRAREARMRQMIARAAADGRRVAAVVGAFHAPALAGGGVFDGHAPAGGDVPETPERAGSGAGPTGAAGSRAGGTGAAAAQAGSTLADGHPPVVVSLVPYTFELLDSRSGYPAGIRDPRWQQAVLEAGGDPDALHAAAARTITDVCRALRTAGHPAGTGEAAEALRVAGDLAALRGLAAPGRGEVLEALTTVLAQGEPLGRGRVLARALESVMVGTDRGRTAPGTPRCGLGPSVEAELAALRLPGPHEPASREVRLDPLRSTLDGRRETLLQRLAVCGADYGEALTVFGTGDTAALTTRWRLAWTPAVPVRLELIGVRGLTAAQAAEGTLRETYRRQCAHGGGPTCAFLLEQLRSAARCDLPALVAERLTDAAELFPAAATLPELLTALDLLEALSRGHLPGTTPHGRRAAAELAADLLESAVRSLPGLAGSDDPQDASALLELAARAAEHRLGLRMDDALAALARTGSPRVQGAALAARVLLDLDDAAALGVRVVGWIDGATAPDGRRRLARRLAGLLSGAAALLQSSTTVLEPLLDRINTLTDQDFIDRLPALRGGFDALTPAGRDRLLHAVTERLGDRPDLSLDASPRLLALWTAADAQGLAAVDSLRPLLGRDATDGSGPAARARVPAAPAGTADEQRREQPAAPGRAAGERPTEPHPVREPACPARPVPRLAPADRWRLLLGVESVKLPPDARCYAYALDELYGGGLGEGADDVGRTEPGQGGGTGQGGAAARGGGQGASYPTVREWAGELDALFGTEVREEVLAQAADLGRTDVLTELDPRAARPSVELLASVLSLAGQLSEAQLARLRPLVRRLVDELARELATRLRPALTGLDTPRPTRRPGGRIDLSRTLRANLTHSRRTDDGRIRIFPERPVFRTRSRKEADWRLILVVDVSASMEASVIWSALTAAVLGAVPTLSTHFLAFSTEVIDLTDRVDDPLSLLLDVRVGGGTHIAAGLAHARSLITVPSRTLVVVVSDFEEGFPLGGLLGEVRALVTSGVHLLGCAALDDSGAPRYSEPIARQLVAAGMPVAALSPLALARWVGDRLRGETP
ncbi:vWA domain-containing protein [Streptomyces massasporeus]|uniref:vWA domain-containing protein n=1 Tax=Streptomyces massasporeus TaxID=67324 RepID=UPI0033DC56F7